MNIQNNGKKIVDFGIYINGDIRTIHSTEKLQFSLLATSHGDREEFWIVGIRDGQEAERYNTKYVACIVWD